jgi:hypothetical protein
MRSAISLAPASGRKGETQQFLAVDAAPAALTARDGVEV